MVKQSIVMRIFFKILKIVNMIADMYFYFQVLLFAGFSKQPRIDAHSTIEAEYIVMFYAVR